MSTQHQFAAAPVPAASDSDPVVPSGGGGSSQAVWATAHGTLATADLTDSNDGSLTIDSDDGTGWALADGDPTTLLPPTAGRYHFSLQCYAATALDEPVEAYALAAAETMNSKVPAAIPPDATNVYAGSTSRDVSITDPLTEGFKVRGSYSNNAPTTGSVTFRVSIHRIGDLPA